MVNNQIIKMFSLLILTNQLYAPVCPQYGQVNFAAYELNDIEAIIFGGIVGLGAYIAFIAIAGLLAQTVKTFGLFGLFVLLSGVIVSSFGVLTGVHLIRKTEESIEEIAQLKERVSILEGSQKPQLYTSYSYFGS